MNFRLFGSMIGMMVLATLLSCQPQTDSAASSGEATAAATTGKIVFIRIDSLTSQYEALKEKTQELETRASDAEQSQNERVAAFQRDAQNFQRRANSGQMSPKQMGVEQERLAGREQALLQEAERLRQELQFEQLKLTAEFEENLLNVLEGIQEEFNYDYILSKAPGSGVLMVNDANDITAEVVKRINLIPMDGESDAAGTDEEAASDDADNAGE
ncbi:MAG: OmpH family outer membrane protein [Bacteroidota bacterium]